MNRSLYLRILLLALMASVVSRGLAQNPTQPAPPPADKTRFMGKISHWLAAYGASGEDFMREQRNDFKAHAYAEVYVEAVIDHNAWMFTMLNRVTKAKYAEKQTPFILFGIKFKPKDDNLNSYDVTLSLEEGSAVNPQQDDGIVRAASTKYLGGKTYPEPIAAAEDIEKAIGEALTGLQAKVGNSLAPNLMVRYQNEVFWNGHEIPILETEGNTVELEAIDKDGRLLNPNEIRWTNADAFQSKGIVDLTGIPSKQVTLTKGTEDPLIVTLTRVSASQDIQDLLKILIIEILSTKKQQAIDTLALLRLDSTANAATIAQYLAALEAGNFPLDGPGELAPMFEVPRVRSDSAAIMASNDVGPNLHALKKRKKVRSAIRRKVNVVALADLIVDQPEKVTILLDELLRSSGQLVARIILNRDSEGQRTQLRNIVLDFLNKNLERVAGGQYPASMSQEPPLEIVAVPAQQPVFDPQKFLYVNPRLNFPGKDELIRQLRANVADTTYVFINYSQDVNLASYQARTNGTRPRGLPEGASYKVFTVLHMPGSLLEMHLSGEGSAPYEDEDYFVKVLQQIRCAYVNGEASIALPERFTSGGNGVSVTGFDYGLGAASSEINGLKIRSAQWTVAAGKTEISGILNPVVNASTGEIILGDFKIAVSPAIYNLNTGVSPFEHFRKYLFPTEANVRADFDKAWTLLKDKNQYSDNDIFTLKAIASCDCRYLNVTEKISVVKKIISVGGLITEIPEEYEDIILDLISTYKGNRTTYANELIDVLNKDKALFATLFYEMDNASDNPVRFITGDEEENEDRLFTILNEFWKDSKWRNISEWPVPPDDNSLLVPFPTKFDGGLSGFHILWTYHAESGKVLYYIGPHSTNSAVSQQDAKEFKYDPFVPVLTTRITADGKIEITDASPAFHYLAAYRRNVAMLTSQFNGIMISGHLFVVGGVQLAAFKTLSNFGRILAVAEVLSSSVDIVITYSGACNDGSELCQDIKEYNKWLQYAAIAGNIPGILKMLNASARKIVTKSGNGKYKIPDELEPSIRRDADIVVPTSAVNRLYRTIDEFKAAIAKGDNVFYVGKHTDISPRPTGPNGIAESHHGVNSVWMKEKYSDYGAGNNAPTVYMLKKPNHNATRGEFNRWAAEMRAKQGVDEINYSKVTNEEIIDLANRQFNVADVPQNVRDEYFRLWNDYIKTLKPK